MAHSEYCDRNSKGLLPTEITFIFRKLEGYIPSDIGARLIPVDRLAGWLAGMAGDENVISFEIFKIL